MQTARQIEIVETALHLINDNGIQGLTIKNLSKKIGISEPAIYRHYENKVEILVAVLDSFGSLLGEIKNDVEKQSGSLSKIEKMFTAFFTAFNENPSLVAVIFSEELFRNEPQLSQKTADIINRNIHFLGTVIEEGIQHGEIRNDISSEHLAIMVMGTLRLFVKKWQLSGFNFKLNSEGGKLIRSVISLISK
ncbi:MAG: TetR/AcrR family transcriptional regulator [Prolixibacteraceae bacterium]|nr:TetR/AcrR family transcriptional regulator [Prolixibacteraceae bacterium]MBN2650218.1 TetR/AcrR family transcriptional regulator [Prolixibacteraceae bacterium]